MVHLSSSDGIAGEQSMDLSTTATELNLLSEVQNKSLVVLIQITVISLYRVPFVADEYSVQPFPLHARDPICVVG